MRKFSIKVNGQPYEVEVEEIGGGFSAPVVPVSAPAPVATPAGGTQLKAPMPGTVIDFKATNGSSVKKGQTVIILEAMKMENEIVAPADGVITFVATKGASVNTDEVLAVIA